jgi:hypothetical protein
MGVVDDIIAKCEEIEKATEFSKTLAGKAKHGEWVEVDPGYTKLKEMSRLAADKVILLAEELKNLIPT